MFNVRPVFSLESSMVECSMFDVPLRLFDVGRSMLNVERSLRPFVIGRSSLSRPFYSRSALSEMSFRHQAPGQRMHLTAV